MKKALTWSIWLLWECQQSSAILCSSGRNLEIVTCRNYLHGSVVHNHAVEADFRVTTGDLLAALQEEAVSQLPAPTNTHVKMYHVF